MTILKSKRLKYLPIFLVINSMLVANAEETSAAVIAECKNITHDRNQDGKVSVIEQKICQRKLKNKQLDKNIEQQIKRGEQLDKNIEQLDKNIEQLDERKLKLIDEIKNNISK